MYDYKALVIKIMLQMFMRELSSIVQVQKEAAKLKVNWELTRRLLYVKIFLCEYFCKNAMVLFDSSSPDLNIIPPQRIFIS